MKITGVNVFEIHQCIYKLHTRLQQVKSSSLEISDNSTSVEEATKKNTGAHNNGRRTTRKEVKSDDKDAALNVLMLCGTWTICAHLRLHEFNYRKGQKRKAAREVT